jgi:hypothetical protein
MRAGISRLHLDCRPEHALRFLVLTAFDLVDQSERAHREPPRIDPVMLTFRGPVAFRGIKMRLDCADDMLRDIVLHGEQIFQHAVVAVRPDMLAGLGLDQLTGDADTPLRDAHTALEHVANAEIARDLAHVGRLVLVDEGRVAGDDEQPAEPCKSGDDVLGQAVGEEVVLGIPAHIDERQHRN